MFLRFYQIFLRFSKIFSDFSKIFSDCSLIYAPVECRGRHKEHTSQAVIQSESIRCQFRWRLRGLSDSVITTSLWVVTNLLPSHHPGNDHQIFLLHLLAALEQLWRRKIQDVQPAWHDLKDVGVGAVVRYGQVSTRKVRCFIGKGRKISGLCSWS